MSQIFLVRSPALSSLDAEIKLELFSWRDHSATIPFFPHDKLATSSNKVDYVLLESRPNCSKDYVQLEKD